MAGTVKLPVVGATSKRTLYLGGGAAVLVTVVLWWRKRNAATAAAAPTSASTDPNAIDPNAIDTSGLDALGLAGGGGSLVSSTPTVSAPTSNPQWTQVAMQDLSGVIDPTALSSALGKYLTGAAVTSDEESLIDQAIAVAGYPPVSGPNGYPPAIRTQPSTGQTPTAPTLPATSDVQAGWPVEDYLARINAGYPGVFLTSNDIKRLNPGIKFGGSPDWPLFATTQTIKLR